MKKKYITVQVAAIIVALTLCSCGAGSTDKNSKETNKAYENTENEAGKDSKEESKAKDDNKETANKETAKQETTTFEETTTGSYSGNYSEFSTELNEYGVGINRLEDGRYMEPLYWQEKWADYNVDFTKENEKVVYLTFDEGYENGYSAKILDVLKEKNCKAVFFVTMDWVKSEPDLVKRMIDEGHVIGNHSVHHKSMPTLSVEEMTNEVMELHNYIKENYNYDMYLFRPPMGHYSEQSLKVLENLGYTTVLWSFAHVDWITDNQPSHDEALKTCEERLHNGALYLLHAVSEANTSVLGEFIDYARASGYTFMEYTRDKADIGH